jgi:ribosomal-protein-alanine N-acetyltransferase
MELPPRARSSPVRLERPSRAHTRTFLAAVAASRDLHRPWVAPPADRASFERYVARVASGELVGYLVVERASGALVGGANASGIVRGAFHSAYLGYQAFAPMAGRGLMRAGLALVLDDLFGVHALHRVEANVQPANERSRRLALSLGFRLEGYSPRYLKIRGRWRDHERYALLAEEWRTGGLRARAADQRRSSR